MIKSVRLRNFKSIKDETYDLTRFDLLVGRNNCGKSTILQALAIWQYCVDMFRRSKRSGKRGIQIVLPNFTALPLPEFNLLWKDKTERQYHQEPGNKKKQEFIYIEITVKWVTRENDEEEFKISLRYQTPQSVYAIPDRGWKRFKELDEDNKFPKIVFVPPFSGLEPNEEWRDDSILRSQVGKGQPGSVLRNLLYRVIDRTEKDVNGNDIPLKPKKNRDWIEIEEIIERLFSVKIGPPEYVKGVSTYITCSYKQDGGKGFEIIAGGSGFHQTLTLLAFLYGYEGLTTIMFDEPDAHMHSNLQREMLDFFKRRGEEKNIQFIIATHAEELIKGVPPTSIVSVLKAKPERIDSSPKIVTALSEVSNLEIAQVTQSGFIIYVEGESDERILRAWAGILEKSEVINKFCFKPMGGGNKKEMKESANRHFEGLKQIVPRAHRIMLFDYDTDENAFHPKKDDRFLHEWRRKNIENYLLVGDAWHRAAQRLLNVDEYNLFNTNVKKTIDNFFEKQNLTLPPDTDWQTVDANIFEVVDGKKILFEQENSLFQQLKKVDGKLILNRETISQNMRKDEIHRDIQDFFAKLG